VFYGARATTASSDRLAVKAVKEPKDVEGMVKAMEKANFNSLRGPSVQRQSPPIEDFYSGAPKRRATSRCTSRRQSFEKHKSVLQECRCSDDQCA